MRDEASIENTVAHIAERSGYITRKAQWAGRRGAPDRVFFGRGRCVWIEFKERDEDIEGQQEREIRRLQAAYPHVHVCDNVEDALRILGLARRFR